MTIIGKIKEKIAYEKESYRLSSEHLEKVVRDSKQGKGKK